MYGVYTLPREAGLPLVHARCQPHPQDAHHHDRPRWMRPRRPPSNIASRSSPRRSKGLGRAQQDQRRLAEAGRIHRRQGEVLSVRALLLRAGPAGGVFQGAPGVLLADRRQAPARERSQLCLTNPDVLRSASRRWSAGSPSTRTRRSSPSRRTTGTAGASATTAAGWSRRKAARTPARCCALSTRVAAEVEKQYPDKLIDTLAYQYTETPPLQGAPAANVRIRLCPIGACERIPTSSARATRTS